MKFIISIELNEREVEGVATGLLAVVEQFQPMLNDILQQERSARGPIRGPIFNDKIGKYILSIFKKTDLEPEQFYLKKHTDETVPLILHNEEYYTITKNKDEALVMELPYFFEELMERINEGKIMGPNYYAIVEC